jgi:peptidyl-tRNA hydrolase, PTH1 family
VKVLVGLGNPGEEYAATRHNIGYLVAEEIAGRRGRPYEARRARSLVSRVEIGGSEAIVARPLTYMNRSGAAVAALLDLAGAGPEDLLVMCDDFYLDFGTIRLRPRGSHGGHNGLLSIVETLGTQDFARLRVGVGPVDAGEPHAEFVLRRFPRRQQKELPRIVGEAADCAELVLSEGLAIAMNRFNRKPADEAGGDAH